MLGLLLCILGIAYATVEEDFASFAAQYNRVYNTPEEYAKRLQIFSDNVKIAQALDEADQHASYGITKFMDLSPEEFKRNYLVQNFTSPKKEQKSNIPLLNWSYSELSFDSVPASFDWRSYGVVTPVYDQGSCGSCWAFSTTENIESMWARAGHGLGTLSMQQLVDCDKASNGCGGGNPPNAYQYVINNGGIDSYASYPYVGADQPCFFKPAGVAAKVKEWGYLSTTDNEQAMLSWTSTYGPPSACVDAIMWQYYRGGVITTGCGTQLDHCIQITGWDTIGGIGAWTVRNSWGTNWGENGYVYVAYGGNICGIGEESQACFTY